MHIRALSLTAALVQILTVPIGAKASLSDSSKSMLCEELQQSWWIPKNYKSKQSQQPEPSLSTSDAANKTGNDSEVLKEPGNLSSSLLKVDDSGNKEPQIFAVPNWFSSQPKPYVRPTETFRPQCGLNGCGASGLLFPTAGTWASGLGYPGLGWGGWGGGWRGGWGGWGGWGGYPGWGGGWGGWRGGWGSWGGWGGYPGWGGGWGWNGLAGGWGGWGFGSHGSLRDTGTFSTAVIQNEPSKASGNYYEPSTVDTTASGSYYASGTPAMTPALPVNNKGPDTFWDENSNPIPKNLR